ncbi:MAG: alkaline phosphatase D family protein [Candidatus Hydrogenedentota bacterium]
MPIRAFTPILVLCSVIFLTPTSANASEILAGPMVGHVTESTASIWVRTTRNALLEAEAIQNNARIPGSLQRLEVGGFSLFQFEGLIPDSPVHVTIREMKDGVAIESHDLLFHTAAPPEPTGTLRIAFGSCSKDSRFPFIPVYEAMGFEQADIAIFVGDNTYFTVGEGDWSTSGPIGDWNSIEQMVSRHMRTRTNVYLQNLMRNTPSYGIWDDHDYGPNNADRELESRDQALEIFKSVWANPYYGTPQTPGIFSKFRRGPADIFLMDDRYHKYVSTGAHPDVSGDDAVIWGDDQLEWLCDELKRSNAPIKIIANGTQVISKDGRGEGHFNEAPQEIDRLLKFLKKNEIGGVIFLSGDRHFTEVLRLDQDAAPSIVEFTSSPFQQMSPVAPFERDHDTNVWAMRGNSYGLVTINVEANGEGSVRFEMRDANNFVPDMNGKPAIYEVKLEELMYAK